jgi:hypothetical protein
VTHGVTHAAAQLVTPGDTSVTRWRHQLVHHTRQPGDTGDTRAAGDAMTSGDASTTGDTGAATEAGTSYTSVVAGDTRAAAGTAVTRRPAGTAAGDATEWCWQCRLGTGDCYKLFEQHVQSSLAAVAGD